MKLVAGAGNREPLALDEARDHAGCNHALENMAQDIALTKEIAITETMVDRVARRFNLHPQRL